METLPPEILCQILYHLKISGVINFSSTNSRYLWIAKDRLFWKGYLDDDDDDETIEEAVRYGIQPLINRCFDDVGLDLLERVIISAAEIDNMNLVHRCLDKYEEMRTTIPLDSLVALVLSLLKHNRIYLAKLLCLNLTGNSGLCIAAAYILGRRDLVTRYFYRDYDVIDSCIYYLDCYTDDPAEILEDYLRLLFNDSYKSMIVMITSIESGVSQWKSMPDNNSVCDLLEPILSRIGGQKVRLRP